MSEHRTTSEEALRQSEARYRTLVETSPDSIALMDLQGQFLSANRETLRLLGYPDLGKLQRSGRSALDFIADEDRDRAYADARRSRTEGSVRGIEYRLISADGKERHVETSATLLRSDSGEPQSFLAVTRDISDRRQAQRELRRYQAAVEHADDGIILTDLQGQVLFANRSAGTLFDYPCNELKGLPVGRFMGSSDIARTLGTRLLARRHWRGEVEAVRRDGSQFCGLLSSSLVLDESGAPMGMLGIFRDITGAKQADEAMAWESSLNAATAEFAKALIDASSTLAELAAITLDVAQRLTGSRDGVVSSIHPETGISLPHAWTRESAAQWIRKPEGSGHPNLWQEALRTGEPVRSNDPESQSPAVQKDGGTWAKNLLAAPAMIGSRPFGLIVLTNREGGFTERDQRAISRLAELYAVAIQNRQIQDQSESIAATLEGIFRAAPVGIGLVKNRVIQWVNELVTTLLGYRTDELMGQSARMLYESQEEFLRVGQVKYAEIELRGIGTVETRWQKKDGNTVEILLSSAPLNPADLAEGAIFTALDITQRKRDEALIKESLQEKEVMLREIHHRVKNNLQTISSLLDLQADATAESAAQEALQNSQRRVRSMALVHEILYQSDELARFDLKSYLSSLARYLAGTHRGSPGPVSLNVEVEGLALALDDAVPCGLIVSELVSNAYTHAFPQGASGSISVRVRVEPSEVTLTVADDGIGLPGHIEPEDVSSLGLRLVHLLSRQLGGRLEIQRENGTLFRIPFPPAATRASGRRPPRPDTKRKRQK